MNLSDLITPILTGLLGFVGVMIALWVNRHLVSAQVDKTAAEASVAKSTARRTDADTTRVIVDLYQEAFDDMKARLTVIEANQTTKDGEHSALVVDLNKHIEGLANEIKELNLQIAGLKDFITSEQGAYSKLVESLNERIASMESVIAALEKRIGELVEQIKGLGVEPVAAAESETAAGKP